MISCVCIPLAMVSSLVEIAALNPDDSENSACTMATLFN